jgi:hypothetical protein
MANYWLAVHKKVGKFVYGPKVEGKALREIENAVENTAKEICYAIKAASINLTDKEWWRTNKWNVASIIIPVAISIAVGLISTRYRIDFEREFSKRPFDFSSGMLTGISNTDFTGKPLFDFGSINPLNYASPKNSIPEYTAKYFPHSNGLIEVNFVALTEYQQNILLGVMQEEVLSNMFQHGQFQLAII